jgi:predicted XRE-type DNA-binding protein
MSNIFEDLDFDKEEAANLKIRADIMLELRRFIKSKNWTQAEAAIFSSET